MKNIVILFALVSVAGCAPVDPEEDAEIEVGGVEDIEDMLDAPQELGARPNFQAPFPCNQSWTYSHHSSEVRRALDFINNSGATNNAPVLASAAGTATRHNQPNGAGQYIKIDHGGGWMTYYFHLSSYSVANGARVAQGQEIGRVGSTGNSSGPHLHYEQLADGVGQNIVIDGKSLAPYPGSYGSKSLVSRNCSGGGSSGGGTKKYWVDTFADAPGYSSPGGARTGTLKKGTNYVFCKVKGPKVQVGSDYNTWWLKTDLDTGSPWKNQYVSAYYLARWGNDVAKDNDGKVIPTCN